MPRVTTPWATGGHDSFQRHESPSGVAPRVRYSTMSNRFRTAFEAVISGVFLVMKRALSLAAFVLALGTLPVAGETALGTWLSPPDHKGQVGHMRLTRCGPAICGTLVRVFDRTGKEITTPNVGRKLLWDMQAKGPNLFNGEVYVPLMKGNFPAEMKVSGNSMTVRGCSSVGICKAQTWQRVN